VCNPDSVRSRLIAPPAWPRRRPFQPHPPPTCDAARHRQPRAASGAPRAPWRARARAKNPRPQPLHPRLCSSSDLYITAPTGAAPSRRSWTLSAGRASMRGAAPPPLYPGGRGATPCKPPHSASDHPTHGVVWRCAYQRAPRDGEKCAAGRRPRRCGHAGRACGASQQLCRGRKTRCGRGTCGRGVVWCAALMAWRPQRAASLTEAHRRRPRGNKRAAGVWGALRPQSERQCLAAALSHSRGQPDVGGAVAADVAGLMGQNRAVGLGPKVDDEVPGAAGRGRGCESVFGR
jgi:hypothetical protein